MIPDFVDGTGRPVPRGRVERVLDYPALTLPEPGWMPAASQAGTQTMAGGMLHLAGSSGALAARTLPVDLAAHEVVEYTVGWSVSWYSYLTVEMSLRDDAGNVGVQISQASTGQPTAVLQLCGAGVPDIPVQYELGPTDDLRRRELTLAVGCRDRSVWLMAGDQVIHHGVYPALRLGVVRGHLAASIAGLPSGQTRELYLTRAALRIESM